MSLIAILRALENVCSFSFLLRTEDLPELFTITSEEAEGGRVFACLILVDNACRRGNSPLGVPYPKIVLSWHSHTQNWLLQERNKMMEEYLTPIFLVQCLLGFMTESVGQSKEIGPVRHQIIFV